jgi:hypothetical protein
MPVPIAMPKGGTSTAFSRWIDKSLAVLVPGEGTHYKREKP